MIDSVLTYSLVGYNEHVEPRLGVYQTVFVQDRTVVATIALSSYSQGLENGQAGSAGGFIQKAGIVVGPNKTDNLPLDPKDVNRTQIRIEHCAYVTFCLVIAVAEARATATVFVAGASGLLGEMKTKSAYLYDPVTGKIRGIHHVTFPSGKRAPSDELIQRRIRACATEAWGLKPGQLGVALARNAKVDFGSALAYDAKSGRVRTTHRPNFGALRMAAPIGEPRSGKSKVEKR